MTIISPVLNLHINRMRLCKVTDLKHPKLTSLNKVEPFHIYQIFKANKIIINHEKSNLDSNGILNLHFEVQSGGTSLSKYEQIKINLPNIDQCKLKLEYPYKSFAITFNDEPVFGGHLPAVLRNIRDAIHIELMPHEIPVSDKFDYLDLELLYVGQSKGRKNNSTALKRLESNSTLQKILAEEGDRDPDSEIWIGLCHFEVISFMMMMPKEMGKFEASGSLDPTKTFMTLNNLDKFKNETINLLEAVLIQYFEPEYNTLFKGSFPSSTHLSYKYFFDIGIHSVIVEYFPYLLIQSRISTRKRSNYSAEFITYQLSGKSPEIGPLTIPSDNN